MSSSLRERSYLSDLDKVDLSKVDFRKVKTELDYIENDIMVARDYIRGLSKSYMPKYPGTIVDAMKRIRAAAWLAARQFGIRLE